MTLLLMTIVATAITSAWLVKRLLPGSKAGPLGVLLAGMAGMAFIASAAIGFYWSFAVPRSWWALVR